MVISLFSCNNGDKTAYIDMDKIFTDFEFTKQKKAEFENTVAKRKEITDKEKLRLQQIYKMFSETKNPDKKEMEKFQIDRQVFEQKVQEDEQQNQAMEQQYSSEIWKQLKQYLEDFRKDKGYTYIFIKANVIGDETKEVTKDATDFVNKKFKGQ